jgi:hypothetical protein
MLTTKTETAEDVARILLSPEGNRSSDDDTCVEEKVVPTGLTATDLPQAASDSVKIPASE